MPDRQVIFIGGIRYSGTTLLDMILANAPGGFSCGEVHKLFISPGNWLSKGRCICGNEGCDIWEKVYRGKERHLYETLFRQLPETTFIVDSSKIPFWIHHQAKRLYRHNIRVKHILIWKTPLESAHSFNKRDLLNKWEEIWIRDHRFYFSVVKDFRAIRYHDLVNNRESLEGLCRYLEIDYFPGKERFWERKLHTIGGNASTRIHLYDKGKNSFKETQDFVSRRTGTEDLELKTRHRSVYYENTDETLRTEVDNRLEKNPAFHRIQEILNSRDVLNDVPLSEALKSYYRTLRYSKTSLFRRRVRFRISHFMRKIINFY